MCIPSRIEFFHSLIFFFFFNDTATPEIYTLSLHDALPIWRRRRAPPCCSPSGSRWIKPETDRKSTRLNSSHDQISYAVFCLKKKKINNNTIKVETWRALVCRLAPLS